MLSEKVFVMQMPGDGTRLGICDQRLEGHRRDFFNDDRDVSRFRRRFTPAKGRMSRYQHSGDVKRIELSKSPYDRMARIGFVI
jgi:hypothetical protein